MTSHHFYRSKSLSFRIYQFMIHSYLLFTRFMAPEDDEIILSRRSLTSAVWAALGFGVGRMKVRSGDSNVNFLTKSRSITWSVRIELDDDMRKRGG